MPGQFDEESDQPIFGGNSVGAYAALHERREAAEKQNLSRDLYWLPRASTKKGFFTADYIYKDDNGNWQQNSIRLGLVAGKWIDYTRFKKEYLESKEIQDKITFLSMENSKQYVDSFFKAIGEFKVNGIKLAAGNRIQPTVKQATQDPYYTAFKGINGSPKEKIVIPVSLSKALTCPITKQAMKEPVTLKSNGYSYERAELEKKGLKDGIDFYPNKTLASIITAINSNDTWEKIQEDIKDILLDPIYLTIPNQAVIVPQGQMFDKKTLDKWLDTKQTNPLTNSKLTRKDVVVDKNVDTIIGSFVRKQIRHQLREDNRIAKFELFITDLINKLPKVWKDFFAKDFKPNSVNKTNPKVQAMMALAESIKLVRNEKSLSSDEAIQRLVGPINNVIASFKGEKRFGFFKPNEVKMLEKLLRQYKVQPPIQEPAVMFRKNK